MESGYEDYLVTLPQHLQDLAKSPISGRESDKSGVLRKIMGMVTGPAVAPDAQRGGVYSLLESVKYGLVPLAGPFPSSSPGGLTGL